MSIFQKILSFLTFYYLVKSVGADEYGKYLINLAIISLLSALGQPVLVNFIQRNTRYQSGVAHIDKQLIQFLVVLMCVFSGIAAGYLILFSSADNLTKKLIFFIILTMYFETICSIILRICERFMPALLYDMILQYLITIVIFYVIMLTNNQIESETLLLIKFSTAIIGLIVTLILMLRYSTIKILKNDKPILKNLIKEYFKLMKFSILKYLMVPTTLIIISYYLSDSNVTYFRFLIMLVGIAGFVQTPLNVVLGPLITKSVNNSDNGNIRRIYIRSFWLGLSSSAALGFAITILYQPIFVRMEFDKSFYDTIALTILLLAQVIKTGFGSVNLILNLTNNTNYSSMGMLLQLLITYLFIWILVDKYLLLGVCVAVTCGVIVNNIYIGLKIRKIINDFTN